MSTCSSGFVAIAVLDRVNPDAFIVRTNVARVEAGRAFDAQYLTGLSADAVPALIEALPTLAGEKRQAVAKRVLTRWSPSAERDWRAWNWDRTCAWRAVGEYQARRQPSTTAGKGALALVPSAPVSERAMPRSAPR